MDDDPSNYLRCSKSPKGKAYWDSLGPDLTEHILSYLPIPSIIRASSVCKLWRSIIRDQSFKTMVSKHSKRLPWLFISGPGKNFIGNNSDSNVFGFDPNYASWYKFSKIILLTDDFFTVSNGFFFYTISSGKIMFQGVVNRQTNRRGFFRDCNPLIGVYNQPPDFDQPAKFVPVGGVGPAHGRLLFDVYNPREKSWELITPYLPQIFRDSDTLLSSALFKGKFYFRGINFGFISSFDLEKRLWSDVRMLKPPGTMYSYLMCCRNRLVLAGLCSVNEDREFKLWEIDEKTLEFSEMGVMPGDMLSTFTDSNVIKQQVGRLKCVGLGDVVYVFNEESRFSNGVCVCEISDSLKCRWRRVPDFPQPVKNIQIIITFNSEIPTTCKQYPDDYYLRFDPEFPICKAYPYPDDY